MKKLWVIITAAVIGLLASCGDPSSGNPNNPPVNPDNKTFIVFDNTQGICTVAVYDHYQRREEDKVAEIPAGRVSEEIEWTPGISVPFYFLYRINLKGINGFTLNYVPKEIGKDQTAVRIDENKTTTITIPKLDETVSSPDELLSNSSYLLIQNNSSFSFQLHRGSSILSPDNSSASIVNSGERAQYTINPGAVSPYQLLVGADYKPLPASIVSFESGRVYSFIFDGNVSLITEIELILENVAGSSSNSSIPETPGAPALTASDGLLTMRWTAVERAENYEVYVSTAQEPPALPVKTVAGTTTVLDGLTNKTVYYIWIKAVNNSGSSDFSPRVRGIPWPANERPAAPERPVIIPGINQLTVNWEECGGAASYEVYINTAPSAPSSAEITTDKTSAVIRNLQNDVLYYVWVRAANSAGKSDYSPLEAGTPKIPTTAPPIPAKPVLTAGSRELAVSWQAVELAEVYEVWLGTSDNSDQSQKQGGDISGGITETVITGLENETVYYVWIKAKNVAGTSGFSPAANAKPSAFIVLPVTPSLPTVIQGSRALEVSWQQAEGALFYEVWIGVTNNSANAQKHGADVSGTSITLSGLT
ncbi:MAG: fibronectin type III domain-containing protein, partial [Spirochaetaceae bacterium]|nr:fibronectin type III domain-containing protein [Spirochaetaceae bacterium]